MRRSADISDVLDVTVPRFLWCLTVYAGSVACVSSEVLYPPLPLLSGPPPLHCKCGLLAVRFWLYGHGQPAVQARWYCCLDSSHLYGFSSLTSP
jgi:hypothetical protein